MRLNTRETSIYGLSEGRSVECAQTDLTPKNLGASAKPSTINWVPYSCGTKPLSIMLNLIGFQE